MEEVELNPALSALPSFCLALNQNVAKADRQAFLDEVKRLKGESEISERIKVLSLGLAAMRYVGEGVLLAAVNSLAGELRQAARVSARAAARAEAATDAADRQVRRAAQATRATRAAAETPGTPPGVKQAAEQAVQQATGAEAATAVAATQAETASRLPPDRGRGCWAPWRVVGELAAQAVATTVEGDLRSRTCCELDAAPSKGGRQGGRTRTTPNEPRTTRGGRNAPEREVASG